jgi:hypothetical protein
MSKPTENEELLNFLALWEQWNILYQKIFTFVKSETPFTVRLNNRLWKDKNTGPIDNMWEQMHKSAKEATMKLAKNNNLPVEKLEELNGLHNKIKELLK